jgi:hypothetical protein
VTNKWKIPCARNPCSRLDCNGNNLVGGVEHSIHVKENPAESLPLGHYSLSRQAQFYLLCCTLFLCDKASNGSAFRAPFQIGELARLHDPVRRLPKEKLRDPLQ